MSAAVYMQTWAEQYHHDLMQMEHDHPDAAIEAAKAWDELELAGYLESDDPRDRVLGVYLRELRERPATPGAQFREVLERTAFADDLDLSLMDFEEAGDLAPPWETQIPHRLNETPIRGCGLTILGGDTGTGKSKLATNAMITACANPNTVVIYLCAELDPATSWLYARQVTGMAKADAAAFKARFPNFLALDVPSGCSYERLVRGVIRRVPDNCDRIIVCVDTINTVVDNCQTEGGDGYFQLMRKLNKWMAESRKETEGLIGWYVLSELAGTDKHILGVKLEKLADTVLRFMDGDVEGQIFVDVKKGRYTGKREKKAFFLNALECTLERVG